VPGRPPDIGDDKGQDKQDQAGKFGRPGHRVHLFCVTFIAEEQLGNTSAPARSMMNVS